MTACVDLMLWQTNSWLALLWSWLRLLLACVTHCWSPLTLGSVATRWCTNSYFLLSYVVFFLLPLFNTVLTKGKHRLEKIYMNQQHPFVCPCVLRARLCAVYSDVFFFFPEINQMLWAPRGSQRVCRWAELSPPIIDWNKRHIHPSVSKFHTDPVGVVCSPVIVVWLWWEGFQMVTVEGLRICHVGENGKLRGNLGWINL